MILTRTRLARKKIGLLVNMLRNLLNCYTTRSYLELKHNVLIYRTLILTPWQRTDIMPTRLTI